MSSNDNASDSDRLRPGGPPFLSNVLNPELTIKLTENPLASIQVNNVSIIGPKNIGAIRVTVKRDGSEGFQEVDTVQVNVTPRVPTHRIPVA